jgi:hypothetical protein
MRARAIMQANLVSNTFLVVLLTPKRKSKRSVEQHMKRMLSARQMETARLL